MSRDDKNKSPRAKRREELKRRRRVALPFFTLLFALAIVAFIIPLRPMESASEKRKLTEFPEFSVDTLLSGEYFDGIGLWFSDTFPFRDYWLAASARLGELHGLNDVVIYGEIGEADELPPADETPAASAEPTPTPEP
uniref:DHHW family protein n=1 Tax=Candidatus Scatomorpha intestinigallinarum TaxID=2840923 RepID=UPI0040290A57